MLASNQPHERSFSYVPESRFGVWFQNTAIWIEYVVEPAIDGLAALITQPTAPNPVILDAGCGGGKAFEKLITTFQPKKLIAVETDPLSVRQAQAHAGDNPVIEVLHEDATESKFADASFDIVFCHQTLHHVDDQLKALAEFKRILKPGGLLLLSESCNNFTESPLVSFLFRHPDGNQRTSDEFESMIAAAGFAFRPNNVARREPWWSQPGMGMFRTLRVPHKRRTATQFSLAATKPAD